MKLKKTFVTHNVAGNPVLVSADGSFNGMVRCNGTAGEIIELLKKDTPPRRTDNYSGFGGASGRVSPRSDKAPQGSSLIGDKVTIGKPLFGGEKKEKAPVFSEGDRVSHMTFGEGEILSVKPMGADILYEIIFDRVGTKKLMATYAKLKKIN